MKPWVLAFALVTLAVSACATVPSATVETDPDARIRRLERRVQQLDADFERAQRQERWRRLQQ